MALEGTGRATLVSESAFNLYVPGRVSHDSRFPFTDGERLHVEIIGDGEALIIKPRDTE